MKLFTRYLPLFVIIQCSSAIAQVPLNIPLNPVPTRVVGQVGLSQSSLNLVEGREFNSPQGLALDLNVTPPILYVADTANSRVLAFRNANSFTNGQKADLVIGQVDFQSTAAQGPRGTGFRNTGLAAPVGLAVDNASNLYVVDSGNSRILRFPKPFSQTGVLLPDLVIGQPGFTTRDANYNGLSASTLALLSNNGPFQAYLAFDSAQNLWVADPGNNRVLRFPVSVLGTSAKNGPAADLVLGQLDFATNTGTTDLTSLNFLSVPTGIVFDQQGRLFVSESQGNVRSRILIYAPPFVRSGQPATRIVGVVPSAVVPQPPGVSEQQFNVASGGLFLINNGVGIADTQNNRLLGFKPVDQFTSNVLTQQAQIQFLFGQSDFSSRQPNQGQPEPGPGSLLQPTAVAVSPTELFIADSANNRVLAVPYTTNSIGTATRVLGQDNFNLNAPNLVEGRELRLTNGVGTAAEAGIVADFKSNPPHLYVADTFNNRILGYRDLRIIKPGDRADIVIGQPDFSRTLINYPSNDQNSPNSRGLFGPTGLLLDPAGNLYVADTGNGRVLRFPDPFGQTGTLPAANLVIGQRNFTSNLLDGSATTMRSPYGLAFASNNGLLVSDATLNRILYFPGAPDQLISGEAATIVFGQTDFTSSSSGTANDDNRFSAPRGIATDSDDRLYISDTGNGRVVIFERAPAQRNDPRSSRILTGLAAARGVYVNPLTSEIWVAAGNAVTRYPKYNDQPLSGFQPNASIPDGGVLAVTQDAYGNLYTADASNRVQINYPALRTVSAATFTANQPLAPGSIATIFGLFDNQFGTQTAAATGTPLPLQLAGIQVLFNNAPVPLYYVGPKQINFLLPQSAPTNGQADLQVTRADTGQILGNFPIPLNIASPAIFTINSNTPGTGQAAAINQDGTVNGKDHPAANGSIVAFFGTGQGVVPGAPADGVAPTGAVSTASKPRVLIGTQFVADDNVVYSGLAPGLPGVWQVNVKIPEDVADTTLTNNITPVVFEINGIDSNLPINGGIRLLTTMWVTAKK